MTNLMREPRVECPHHGLNQFALVRGGESGAPYTYYLACMDCAKEVLSIPPQRYGKHVFQIQITYDQAKEYSAPNEP